MIFPHFFFVSATESIFGARGLSYQSHAQLVNDFIFSVLQNFMRIFFMKNRYQFQRRDFTNITALFIEHNNINKKKLFRLAFLGVCSNVRRKLLENRITEKNLSTIDLWLQHYYLLCNLICLLESCAPSSHLIPLHKFLFLFSSA